MHVARACLMNGVRSSDGRDPNARLLSPVPVSCKPHMNRVVHIMPANLEHDSEA